MADSNSKMKFPAWIPKMKCKYHPDAILTEDYRAGDLICTECGLVVGDRVVDVRRFCDDQSDLKPNGLIQ